MVQTIAAGFCVAFAAAAGTKVAGWDVWTAFAANVTRGPGAPPPRALTRAVSVLVPTAEVGVAALALARPALGLALSAALLAVFAVFVGLRLDAIAGARCSCFGSLLPARVDRRLVVRNAGLATVAAAAAVVAAAEAAPPPQLTHVLIAAAALGGFVLFARARSAAAPMGPRTGMRLAVPGAARRPALVLLLSPGCAPCESAAALVRGLADRGATASVIAIIGPGAEADRAALAAQVGPRARLDLAGLAHEWGVVATPYAVSLDRRSTVIEAGAGVSAEVLETMVRRAIEGEANPAPQAHEPAVAGVVGSLLSRRKALASIAAAIFVPLLPRAAFGRADPNQFTGTCKAFDKYSAQTGVTQPDGSTVKGELGHTGWKTPFPSTVLAKTEKVTPKLGTLCPDCATEGAGICFETAPDCVTNCKASIGSCSGRCGQRCEIEVCYDLAADFALLPDFKVTVMRWTPQNGAAKGCRQYAKSINQKVVVHEQTHLAHNKELTKEANARLKNRKFRACAKTEGEARAMVEVEVTRLLTNVGNDLDTRMTFDGKTFDASPAGQPIDITCAQHC